MFLSHDRARRDIRKAMRKVIGLVVLAVSVASITARADNVANRVKKAVEKGTLDQPGTKPFHLKAALTPSLERDNVSGRTGTVEIWWTSPTRWRREVACPTFHQIQVVDGDKVWERNDGDYFPEWLRNLAVELINPVPKLREALVQMDSGEVKDTLGTTYIQWMIPSSDGLVKSWIGATIALNDGTGLLFYGGAFGWDGLFHDYRNFHGRMVAQTVSAGSPEVTAKVTVLEDLKEAPDLFDVSAPGGDGPPLRTIFIDESAVRGNLLPTDPAKWPAVKDGPLEGAATAEIAIDREGKVREVKSVVSVNNAVREAAMQQIPAMRFKPFLLNGVPVQVVSRITLSFKTTRPSQSGSTQP